MTEQAPPSHPDAPDAPGGQAPRRLETALFAGLSLLAFAGGVWLWAHLVPEEEHRVSVWNQCQYHMDYARWGFVRRGVSASILARFGAVTPDRIVAWAVGVVLVVCALFWTLMHRAWRDAAPLDRRLLFAIFATSGASFAHMGYDLGRLDQLNLVLLLGAVLLIWRDRMLAASLLAALAVLVHEAFLFMMAPTLILIALDHLRRPRPGPAAPLALSHVRGVALFVAPMGLTAVVAFFWGFYEGGNQPLIDYFHSQGLFRFAKANEAWTRRPSGHLAAVAPDLFSARKLTHIAQSASYVLLLLFLTWRIARANGLRPGPLLIAPLCGLALIPIGLDAHRWIANSGTVAMVMLAHVAWTARGPIDARAVRDWPGLLLLASAALGPIGIQLAYPMKALWTGGP